MIALMTLWFGPAAGLPLDGGYFYLCPGCYQLCIAPHVHEILHRLTEHHPLGRRSGGAPGTAAPQDAGEGFLPL